MASFPKVPTPRPVTPRSRPRRAPRPGHCQYLKIECLACSHIVGLHRDWIYPPLPFPIRNLARLQHCPLCHSSQLRQHLIHPHEYLRIDQHWDLAMLSQADQPDSPCLDGGCAILDLDDL